jgi:hypothetical protein
MTRSNPSPPPTVLVAIWGFVPFWAGVLALFLTGLLVEDDSNDGKMLV